MLGEDSKYASAFNDLDRLKQNAEGIQAALMEGSDAPDLGGFATEACFQARRVIAICDALSFKRDDSGSESNFLKQLEHAQFEIILELIIPIVTALVGFKLLIGKNPTGAEVDAALTSLEAAISALQGKIPFEVMENAWMQLNDSQAVTIARLQAELEKKEQELLEALKQERQTTEEVGRTPCSPGWFNTCMR